MPKPRYISAANLLPQRQTIPPYVTRQHIVRVAVFMRAKQTVFFGAGADHVALMIVGEILEKKK